MRKTARIATSALMLALCGAAGLWAGSASAAPTALPAGAPAAAPAAQPGLPEVTTLRLYGDSVVCDSCIAGESNRPATAGADGVVDPNTGRVPEDPPYTDPRGPFSPLSAEAPRHDFVTWDPAWISERLGELNNPPLSEWACAGGLDEVSAASNIRAGGVNASEKVWLRHWYEPTHLDKDLNADDCLSDENLDGIPDAPSNPTASNDDEWYPAIMTELTYLLTENELPIADPEGDEVDDQAPRPFCGEAGGTRWVFPVGTFADATNENGPAEGQGLTSLDADFDGAIDMVNVTSERELADTLGLTIDFDGDGIVDDLDPAGPLSCDAMVVMHTDALTIGMDGMLQFLDHYVRLRAANDSSATLEVWYNGDLQPRLVATISLGQGSAALAGDVGPIPVQDRINAGGDNLGTVPSGPWFVYLSAADGVDNTATVMVGRALGAPCASMESAPNVANLSPGGPWHLKRFYVDGHEYNVAAIQTCSPTELQYITLRAPLPKVPATIEQHSVRLQPYDTLASLVLPPPYNYEHTILEDVVVVAEDEIGPCPVYDPLANPFDPDPRPDIHYMGGPVGPVPPVLSDADGSSYVGRDPARPVGPYQGIDFYLASHWFYVDEDVNPQMLGQLREKYGAGRIGGLEPVFANEAEDRLCEALGVGGFACSDTDTVGDGRGVAVGDFDGDNIVDLIYANVGGPNRVCLGDGAGGYSCADLNADANDSEAVAVADVDGDGNADAVFANSSGASRVCLGDGAGGFACADAGGGTGFSRDVALGFVDGDTNLDAVFAEFGNNRVCLGDGAGGFACADVSVDINSSEGVSLADLDQDGVLDAVFANTGAVNRVCLGLGGGAFSCSDVEGLVEPTQAVALGDLNGDLLPDAVFANLGVPNRLCFGDGTGAFACDEFKPDLLNDTDVAFGDLEGDGDLDVLFGVLDGPNRICEADGSGGFACTDVAAEVNRTWGVALADVNGPAVPLDAFFFNEQMWTRPWSYTEFYLPDHTGFAGCDPDAYSVTTGFTNPTARWRLWSQPDGDVPDDVPPPPPDLVLDNTGYDPTTGQYGAPRRAGFVYDPDRMDPIYTSQDGVRLHGGWPDCPDGDCDGEDSRPDVQFGAGDVLATDTAGYPVEVPPYTDPFAPFNPQAPDAPRGDLLTFNPAYMDEFRNFGEPLRLLYQQLSNMSMNAREKVYQRAWYQPEYVTKIRDFDDCDTDLSFPAVMQEFTYLMMDTTDNPRAVPVPGSRLGFPIATGASELPRPNLGGSLPVGGEFGYGLTSFDADFDGYPEAVGLHTELSINDVFSTTFAANRPQPPFGVPVLPLPGALVDFDGDGIVTDTLDADCVSLNGNEMVVMTVESIVLDAEDDDPTFGHAAQFLDHMVVAENVTAGTNPRAQLRFYFAGGTIGAAVPESVGGTRTLGIGSVAVVDRFQDRVRIIDPGESNAGMTDGAWFVFVEDVSEDGERVTLTLGRALGATHSAIDDGDGNHDLTPGDPWYLKRFYVDGHEYNVTALMTNNAPGADPTDPLACNDRFGFITIRTPVPKGNYFNPQDSLFQQGYFLNGLPPQMSVMPPFNVDHTIVEDVERIEANEFANLNFFDACVGSLAAAGPQVQTITEEEPELRFGQELRETYRPAEGTNTLAPRFEDGWETHQLAVTPGDYTEIRLPEGQNYLLTLNWRSEVSRLAFYGCTRDEPGPFDDEDAPPQITHDDVVAAAAPWDPALIPAVNHFNPRLLDEDANQIQDITPYYDARCSVTETVRVKLFYDPTEDDDLYVNKRPLPGLLPELDLSIDKQIDSTVAVAGELVSFILTAQNDGPVDAPNVTIVDQLPLGLLFEGSTGACVSNGGTPETVRCDMGPLAAGASAMVTISARVDAAVPDGTQLENVGRVEVEGAIDTNPANNVAIVSATVREVADLSIDKTVPVSTQAAGTELTYTLAVTNDGPSVATGVTIEDQLPAAVTFVGTDRPDLCSLSGSHLLRCLVGTMGPGTAIAIDVTVAIPADVPPGTLLVNDASVGGDGTDPDPSDDQDDETVLVEAVADLAISKTAEPDPVNAGEQLTYTLTVTNSGPSDAPAVEVVDQLPAEVAYVGSVGAFCSGVSVGSSGTLTCQLGSLAAGASDSFQIIVDVDPATQAGTRILNSAVASGPGSSDPDPGDNDDDVEVEVEVEADLAIDKSTVAEVLPGEEFDWEISVVNDGPGTATSVVVSDTLPADTTFVSATGASCSGVAVGATGTLVCSIGTMAPAAGVSIDVRLRVDDAAVDGQILTNAAAVGGATNDSDPSDDTVIDTTTVRRVADVSVQKSGPTTAIAGDRITYTIRVDNAGPATATDVVFTDTLPAGSTLVAVPSGCVESPVGILTCSLGSLPAGGFSIVSVSVDLAPSLQQGAILRNTVVVDTTADDPQPGNDQAIHDLDIERQADLMVALADDPDPVAAGASLLYTATVSNLGLSDADGVMLNDVLPAGVGFDSASPGCNEGLPGEVDCSLGALLAGATRVVTIAVTVDPSLIGGTVLIDTASVGSATSDPNSGNNDDSESTLVEARVDLAVTKTAEPSTVVAGEIVTYAFTVTNAGPSTAMATTFGDTIPAEVTLLAATPGCSEAPPGTLGCALGDLAPGATRVLTATGRLDASAPVDATVVNTATVSSAGIEQNAADNSDTASFLVDASADLRLDKVAPALVLPGAELVFQLHVDNDGPSDALGVTISDTLPAGTTYGSAAGGSCVEAPAGVLTCDLGGLAAGGDALLTVTVTVGAGLPEDTILLNDAGVSANTADPNGANNSDTTMTTVRLADEADLSVIKTAGDPAPGVGETFAYSVFVQNDGPRAAPDTVVTDTLPAGLSFVAGPCTEPAPGTLRCELGELAAGASTTLPVSVTVDSAVPGSTLVNTATVVAGLPDPQPADNTDTATVTITARADLVLSKSATPSPVAAGGVLTYSLVVTNTGPSTATGVVVSDTLPAGVTHLSNDGGCNVSALPTIVCGLGAMASGATASVTIVVQVDAGLADGASLRNTASTASPVVDPNPGNNDDEVSTPVVVQADLALSKSASPEPATAGEDVTYTLVVRNLGPSNATGVVLSDTLPAGVDHVSDNAGCDASAPPLVSCTLGAMAAGDTVTVSLRGHIDPSFATGDTLRNTAAVAASSPDPVGANNDAEATSTLLNVPSLTLDKTGAGEVMRPGSPPTIAIVGNEVTAGQRLTYTLTTSNSGPSTGLTVEVVDVLPAEATYVSDTGGCVESPAGTLTCALGHLLPGASTAFDVVVDIAPDIVDGSIATNVANVAPTVTFDQSLYGPAGATMVIGAQATQETTIGVMADLQLSKIASSSMVAVGEAVTFTLVVTNAGPSLARGVVVSDTLPAGLSYAGDDAGCVTGALPTLSCSLGDLAVGASTSFQVVATGMAGYEGSPLVNRARVLLTGGGEDPDDSNDQAEAQVETLPVADLVIAKSGEGARVLTGPTTVVQPDAVTAGEALSYTLVVTNTGPSAATSVVVTDTLPAGVSLLSAPAGCDTGGLPVLPCTIPDLPLGASTTLAIQVAVDPDAEPGSLLLNQAYVTAAAHDPTPGDNSVGQATEVFVAADLALSKVADPVEAPVGDLVTYTLTVMNAGPSLARDVRVTDTLPVSVTAESLPAGCSEDSLGVVGCELGDLAPAASAVISFTARIGAGLDGTDVVNEARVAPSATTLDPDAGNDSDEATVSVPRRIDLRVTKGGAGEVLLPDDPSTIAIVPNMVTAGQRVTYTLQVHNDGPSSATTVVLTDTVPAGVSLLAVDHVGCMILGTSSLHCALGVLAVGSSETVILLAEVDASVSGGTMLRNEARVFADEMDLNEADNVATQDTEVASWADLAIDKTASSTTVERGSELTYTLRVENLGPSVATTVVLTDLLPSRVTLEQAPADCDLSGLPLVSCPIEDLAPGDVALRTLVVRANVVPDVNVVALNWLESPEDGMLDVTVADIESRAALGQAETLDGATSVAMAVSPTWPTVWSPLATDVAEPGCVDHRDILRTYVAQDTDYLYLRMENVSDAGWPGTGPGSPEEARYKWWLDTSGADASVSGTSVNDAEFMIMVEDSTGAADATGSRDALGEMTLMDDPTNVGFTARWDSGSHYITGNPQAGPPATLWQRVLGTGTPGLGGPQSALSNADLGYRIDGDTVDMYLSWDAVGDPEDALLFWATDIHNNNLDQAPNCDRPSITQFVSADRPLRNEAGVAAATQDPDSTNNMDSVIVGLVTPAVDATTTLLSDGTVELSWLDRTSGETDFWIMASGAGSPSRRVAPVPSRSGPETGDEYRWLSPPLPAGVSVAFHVVAVREAAAEESASTLARTETLVVRGPAARAEDRGCLVGEAALNGRSRHDGLYLLVDGLPVAGADRAGDFRLCGVAPGLRGLTLWAPGYLMAAAQRSVVAGETFELPWVTLSGGDIDGDALVSVADLVLVGAAMGEGGDSVADLNADGRVDRLDMAIVSAHLDRRGPIPWWDGAELPDLYSSAAGGAEPDSRAASLSMQVASQEDGRRLVKLTASGVRHAFGADIQVRLDPARARWVDVEAAEPGAQVAVGSSWWTGGEDAAYVARNFAQRESGELRLVATRMRPAPSLRGDLVLATFELEPVGEEAAPEEALRVGVVRLLDPRAREIPVHIEGMVVGPWTPGVARLYLPFLQR